MITFKANAFFLVGSHMRISVPLVLVFVRVRVTLKPNILMTVHMSIEVSFVLETSFTSFVFAHEIELGLMCDLMLLQSTFEREALTTIFTNETKVIVKVHMLVQ